MTAGIPPDVCPHPVLAWQYVHLAPTQSAEAPSKPVVPIRVATFSLTPHYRKVFALLKISSPAVGRRRRPAAYAPLRRGRAGHRLPAPVTAVVPVKISPLY